MLRPLNQYTSGTTLRWGVISGKAVHRPPENHATGKQHVILTKFCHNIQYIVG